MKKKLGRPTDIPDAIIDILKKGPISGRELKTELRKKFGDTETIYDTKVSGHLSNLMMEKKVKPWGYDNTKDKRKQDQSFIYQNFIFILRKEYHFIEIKELINEFSRAPLLDTSVTSESVLKRQKALMKLEEIFKDKLNEIITKKMEIWENYGSRLICKELSKDQLLCLESYNRLNRNMMIFDDDYIRLKLSEEEYIHEMEHFRNVGNLEELYKKYEHRRFWHLDGDNIQFPPKNPDAFKLIRPYYTFDKEFFNQNWDLQLKEQGFGRLVKKEQDIRKIREKDEEKLLLLFDYQEPLNKTDFLEWKLGFPKPEGLKSEEMGDIFDKIIIHISSTDEGKKELIERFARGLSDHKKSNKYLDELIKELTGKNLHLYFDLEHLLFN